MSAHGTARKFWKMVLGLLAMAAASCGNLEKGTPLPARPAATTRESTFQKGDYQVETTLRAPKYGDAWHRTLLVRGPRPQSLEVYKKEDGRADYRSIGDLGPEGRFVDEDAGHGGTYRIGGQIFLGPFPPIKDFVLTELKESHYRAHRIVIPPGAHVTLQGRAVTLEATVIQVDGVIRAFDPQVEPQRSGGADAGSLRLEAREVRGSGGLIDLRGELGRAGSDGPRGADGDSVNRSHFAGRRGENGVTGGRGGRGGLLSANAEVFEPKLLIGGGAGGKGGRGGRPGRTWVRLGTTHRDTQPENAENRGEDGPEGPAGSDGGIVNLPRPQLPATLNEKIVM